MPKVKVTGFCESSIATLPDADLLALFSSVGNVVEKRFLRKRECISSWQILIDYLKSKIGHSEIELFHVLFLDKRNKLIADVNMGVGTVDHVPVYPREVVKRALELNACALILVHNHPSGDTSPSHADIEMTKTIKSICEPLGIVIHDHIIIGRGEYTSLRARGSF